MVTGPLYSGSCVLMCCLCLERAVSVGDGAVHGGGPPRPPLWYGGGENTTRQKHANVLCQEGKTALGKNVSTG